MAGHLCAIRSCTAEEGPEVWQGERSECKEREEGEDEGSLVALVHEGKRRQVGHGAEVGDSYLRQGSGATGPCEG